MARECHFGRNRGGDDVRLVFLFRLRSLVLPARAAAAHRPNFSGGVPRCGQGGRSLGAGKVVRRREFLLGGPGALACSSVHKTGQAEDASNQQRQGGRFGNGFGRDNAPAELEVPNPELNVTVEGIDDGNVSDGLIRD